MNVQIGNREKIVGLVVACLVTIGLVHWFLIMGKAKLYRDTYNSYMETRMLYQSSVSPGSANAINKFIDQNHELQAFIEMLNKDLNVQWEPLYFDNSTTDGAKKRQAMLSDLVNQICDLRGQTSKVKLSFFDLQNGRGWDLPTRLPSDRSQLVWDQVNRIQNTARLLDVMGDPYQRMNVQMRYDQELMQLGINVRNLDMVKNQGELVPIICKIAHARLLWALKQRDEKAGGAKLPIRTMDDLYALLRVRLPDNLQTLFFDIKQLQFLLKLFKLAEDAGIDEINYIKLDFPRKIDDVPVAAKHRLLPERHWDQMAELLPGGYRTGATGMNPWSRTAPGYEYTEGGEAGWEGAAPPRPGFAPAPGAGAVTATGQPVNPLVPTPTPEPIPIEGGAWLGTATPITIGFITSWENALGFLYTISHNRNPYTLDSVKITAGQGGKIQTEATLVPMAWVGGIEAFYAPETTATLGVAPLGAPLVPRPLPAGGTPPGAAPVPPAAGPPRIGGGVTRPTVPAGGAPEL